METRNEQHKEQISQKEEELNTIKGTLQVKDEYIKELEEKNDDFQGEIEKISYETFIQIKNDLFAKDLENERLADRK